MRFNHILTYVTIAQHMAISPGYGKSLPDSSKQGELRLSKASGSTCIKAVERITPAENTLKRENISLSGMREKVYIIFPKNGMEIPTS